MANKGYLSKDESFAKGGAVIGKNSEFLKTPNRFIGTKLPKPEPTEDDFEKGKGKSVPKAKDKSLTPIKPKK